MTVGADLSAIKQIFVQKNPRSVAGVFYRFVDSCLVTYNIGSLRPLGPVFNVKRNFLAFSQNLEAFSLDSGKVNKHVFAAV